MKDENNQANDLSALATQTRRETRNSAKAAAMRKQKENSNEIADDNKRKLMYVSYYLLS